MTRFFMLPASIQQFHHTMRSPMVTGLVGRSLPILPALVEFATLYPNRLSL
nr:hypothetical protein [Arthrospira sp. PLM2.Bin9]